MRGRLLNWCWVELEQLDTTASATDVPAGVDGYPDGYDPDFREARSLAPEAGEQVGETTRATTLLQVKAQFTTAQFEKFTMNTTGMGLDNSISATLHFRELEQRGLIDENGYPKIRIGDQLKRILHARTRAEVFVPNSPPGLWVREVKPQLVGIGKSRNLIRVLFESVDRGTKSAAG